ncbi:F-box/kelch-repeat protein At3g23880-like [Bidens hawaiensis]|uniref:F-box/kelch-repeat protein At3g23880-like n=1 Tax=Bidens hawaiensis TaxID=980011 RepID=UPI0040498F89
MVDALLAFDIIFNILSRLPAKSLIRFQCVCTSFPPLISHPCFTKLHLTTTVADNHRTIISYDSNNENNKHMYFLLSLSPLTFHQTAKLTFPFKSNSYRQFPGSNKGLICYFDSNFHSSSGTLIIWNPIINKHKTLDGPHNDTFSLGDPTKDLWHHRKDQFSLFVFGFGFVSRTCEFKVVGIVCDYGVGMKNIKGLFGMGKSRNKIKMVVSGDGGRRAKILVVGGGRRWAGAIIGGGRLAGQEQYCLVYSLSTNSWEVKEGVRAPCYLSRLWSSTTVVNGFMNWLAYKEDGSRVIMAFALDNEGFQVYDLPKDIVPNYDDLGMHSFGEEDSLSLSLSLCARYREVNGEKWDVWVMGEYGVVESWKKVFVISQPTLSIRPLLIKNEREVLIVMNDGRLKLFDAIKNEMQDLETKGHDFHGIRYTASLALLDG